MSYIYVASPYSDPDPAVRRERYEIICNFVQARARRENHVTLYSPIVHWHPISETYGLPGHFEFWKRINFAMILASSAVWVVRLPGWEGSLGVQSEINFAKESNKHVTFIDFDPEL